MLLCDVGGFFGGYDVLVMLVIWMLMVEFGYFD